MAPLIATVLFVDIVSSTEHVRRLGDARWGQLLEEFHSTSARAVSAAGGRRVKDTGDGLLATFGSPSSAARCARDLLAGHGDQFEIRIGLHSGECELTTGGDLRGAAVHLAARVMAAAQPGEALVSSTVRDLLVGHRVGLEDAGQHALKGFDEPLHLFRLRAEGGPAETIPTVVMARTELGPAFVGRAAERGFVDDLLASAEAGELAALGFEGEAGIGKSRLIGEAARAAQSRGFAVLAGGADEMEADRPFRALREAFGLDARSGVDVGRAELLALLEIRRAPDLGQDTPDTGGAVVDASLDVLERMALTAPVLLAVDDLQWADLLTLRVLRALCRRLEGLPIALIAGFRVDPRPPELDRVLDAIRARRGRIARVHPLSEDAVEALATDLAGAQAGSELRQRLSGAGGNPLFIAELLGALQDDGQIEVRGGVAECTTTDLPADLRMTLLRRLGTLAPDTVELLRCASVLGSTFTVTDLATVRASPVADVVRALTPALRSGLVGEVGDRMAFRHDLIRESIYNDFPGPVRRALHVDAARALVEAGRVPSEVAEHYLLGAEPGDPQAIAAVRSAAEDASRGSSPATALRLLERLLPLMTPGTADYDDVTAGLLRLLPAFGRHDDAEQRAREVLARHPSPELEARVHFGLAVMLALKGDMACVEQFEHTAGLPGADDTLRSRALDIANLSVARRDPRAAEAVARARLSETLDAGDVNAEYIQRQTLILCRLAQGDPEEALEHAFAAVALRDHTDIQWASYMFPHLFAGVTLAELDRFPEALDFLREGAGRAEASGIVTDLPFHEAVTGIAHYLAGRWDEAQTELDAGCESMEEAGRRDSALLTYSIQARLALHRGEAEKFEHVLALAQAVFAERGPELGVDWLVWTQSLALEREGQLDAATDLLAGAWEMMADVRYLVGWRLIGPDLVRMAMASGDAERAAAVTGAVEEGARCNPAPTAQGAALLCRGMSSGDDDVLVDAVAAYREGPRLPDLARAIELTGQRLASSHPADGEALLKEAFTMWDGLGARADADRVAASLGNAGANRRSRRTSFGWDALTPAELRVAELVAEGLTNKAAGERLYVSRRTVETHLSHIFTKLGVSSRAQVAAHAARQSAAVSDHLREGEQ